MIGIKNAFKAQQCWQKTLCFTVSSASLLSFLMIGFFTLKRHRTEHHSLWHINEATQFESLPAKAYLGSKQNESYNEFSISFFSSIIRQNIGSNCKKRWLIYIRDCKLNYTVYRDKDWKRPYSNLCWFRKW